MEKNRKKQTGRLIIYSPSQSNLDPYYDPRRIPQKVVVFTTDLIQIESKWIDGPELEFEIPAGQYLVQIFMLSQLVDSVTLDIIAGNIYWLNNETLNNWNLYKETISMVQEPEMKYERVRPTIQDAIINTEPIKKVRAWYFDSYSGINHPDEVIKENFDLQEEYGRIKNYHNRGFLEIISDGFPTRFICLPTYNDLQFKISAAKTFANIFNPLEIFILTPNMEAETILNLLSSNSIVDGKAFLNARVAERLLYHKISDPMAAALGGYFLLKVRDFEKMHDWPANLCNWFPWMPDGAVIYSWQMIGRLRDRNDRNVIYIRNELLKAHRRGIPIYTEGLRLLHDGLNLLSYQCQNDEEVIDALAFVKKVVDHADMSQMYTTFYGLSPFEPGIDDNISRRDYTLNEKGYRVFKPLEDE